MKQRLRRLLVGLLLLVILGLGYAAWISWTGVGIVCPFYTITGLQCPGCGVTHLCLALLRLDFEAAWQANPGLMVLLPFLGYFLLRWGIDYVRLGRPAFSKWEQVLIWVIVLLLLGWGIVRNIYQLW